MSKIKVLLMKKKNIKKHKNMKFLYLFCSKIQLSFFFNINAIKYDLQLSVATQIVHGKSKLSQLSYKKILIYNLLQNQNQKIT